MLDETVKLNMNEVPYPPPPPVRQAAAEGLTRLQRYVEPEDVRQLAVALAEYAGVSQEHIIVSPGSDLLLRELVLIFSKDRKVIMVSPSFFPTVQTARQFVTKLVSLRLAPPDFALDMDLLRGELAGPCLVILDNPNNPTGQVLLEPQDVETLVAHPQTLVVIDEAYYEFCGVTCAELVARYPNLAVTRTLDKAFSLAGARVGYAIVGEAFRQAFAAFYAFLSQSSLGAALAALGQPDYAQENVRRVVEERERVRARLATLPLQVYPSATNFLLMRVQVPDLVRRLASAGVRISDLSHQLPPGFVRVSVGAREENDVFIRALEALIKEAGQ
jgi:histidinol-phosphate aminotransferase